MLCSVGFSGTAWSQEADTLRTIEVEEIVVHSARSLRDIGVQKTLLGREVLTDNLAASMAEVLAQNSTVFIKSSGRATLSTASLRGTAPSHTEVTWNGIDLGSPMLGMVDFSMIPSYFVDGGEVYHGATSVGVTGGGLGGAVVLSTDQSQKQGLDIQLIQNLASYHTHDEYLRINYSNGRWGSSTRALYSSSDNDFEYTNYDKYGHPVERNKNCGYNDLHLLQEFFYNSPRGGHWSLKGWCTDSHRGIPRLTVDFRDDDLTKSWQDEQSLKSVAEWRKAFGGLRLYVRTGYNLSSLHYVFQLSLGGGQTQRGVDSSSISHHAFSEVGGEWSIGNKLMLAGNLKGNIQYVNSQDIAPFTPVGYEAFQQEISAFASARWKPTEWFGAAVNLREEMRDGAPSPLIPALFIDITLWQEAGLILSGSLARNFHYPSLNDLYFVPGGNPNLQPESGKTSDLGVGWGVDFERVTIGGKITGFNSDINNWILWTPTIKGFWTPQNLQRVVSRGVEARANIRIKLAKGGVEWHGIMGYTSSFDASVGSNTYGNQLPYIPLYSASMGVRFYWDRWELNYKLRYYSERFTSYSNSTIRGNTVPEYSLSDVSVAREFSAKNMVHFKVRFDVFNLFDRYYQSVLSRPMPPRNYGVTLECKFGV